MRAAHTHARVCVNIRSLCQGFQGNGIRNDKVKGILNEAI